MWPTSTGVRTLHGAEAVLVSSAVLVMLNSLDEHICEDDDDLFIEPTADMQIGIALFDSLTIPQRIATLHHVSRHLLTDALPISEETSAIDDATIAAIYSEISDQVAIEVGFEPVDLSTKHDRHEHQVVQWRSMVLAACQEAFPDEDEEDLGLPESPYDRQLAAWESTVELLASAILWDRDYELADGFMDEDPISAKQRRKLLGIPDDYFVEPPPDPTASEARRLLAQARSIAMRRPR